LTASAPAATDPCPPAAVAATVRPATTADAEAVARLLDRLMAEVGGLPTAGPDRDTLDAARRLLGLRGAVWGFLAETPQGAVGVAMVNERAAVRAGGLFGEITEIYVLPAVRDGGIGYALLGAVKALAARRGWAALEIGPPPGPEWARLAAFLGREGFAVVGDRLRWTA
jgi:GNAT superfamily N-acetyltransferase